MAEVSRLEALVTAQAKTDFISLVSHELRSPLHGILASLEFLQETSLTKMQVDMLDTINECGKALLDTINHVLDFSKMNKKSQDEAKKSKKGSGKRSNETHSERRINTVQAVDVEDICILTEGIIDTLYAGHDKSRRHSSLSAAPNSREKPVFLALEQPVIVIIDVAWRSN